jgi:hypothetical protein
MIEDDTHYEGNETDAISGKVPASWKRYLLSRIDQSEGISLFSE